MLQGLCCYSCLVNGSASLSRLVATIGPPKTLGTCKRPAFLGAYLSILLQSGIFYIVSLLEMDAHVCYYEDTHAPYTTAHQVCMAFQLPFNSVNLNQGGCLSQVDPDAFLLGMSCGPTGLRKLNEICLGSLISIFLQQHGQLGIC